MWSYVVFLDTGIGPLVQSKCLLGPSLIFGATSLSLIYKFNYFKGFTITALQKGLSHTVGEANMVDNVILVLSPDPVSYLGTDTICGFE